MGQQSSAISALEERMQPSAGLLKKQDGKYFSVSNWFSMSQFKVSGETAIYRGILLNFFLEHPGGHLSFKFTM